MRLCSEEAYATKDIFDEDPSGCRGKLIFLKCFAFAAVLTCASGGLGFGIGLRWRLPMGLLSSSHMKLLVDGSVQDLQIRDLDPVSLAGVPMRQSSVPLWRVPYADFHGAKEHNLGVGMLYYSIAYVVKPKTAVVLGSGAGFVPALVRRGQIASGNPSGKTYLIDLGFGMGAMPRLVHDRRSDFRQAFPEIVVLTMKSNPDGAWALREREEKIDYLHIDADHTYKGGRSDLEAFLPLLAPGAVVTMHDTNLAPPVVDFGIHQLVHELRGDPCWDLVNFASLLPPGKDYGKDQFGAGTAIVKYLCGESAAVSHTPSNAAALATSCPNSRKILPDCQKCVPGLRGLQCEVVSRATNNMREALTLGLQKESHVVLETSSVLGLKLPGSFIPPVVAGWAHVGTSLDYMASADYIEDQRFVASWLQKSQPRRILDLGAKTQPMEHILRFSAHWCPELLITVDPATDGSMQKLACSQIGSMSSVSLVHVPATVDEALDFRELAHIHFDAIVCLGCGAPWGPTPQRLEAFKRPYKLFLGEGPGAKGASAFADLPTASGSRIVSRRYGFGSSGLDPDSEHRVRVIEYQYPSQF